MLKTFDGLFHSSTACILSEQMKLLKNMIDLSYGISEKLGEASVKGEIVDVTMCLILQQ